MARGRRTKCTAERTKEIAEKVRIGLTHEVAARSCGVSASAFYEWTARGRAERERLKLKGSRRRKKEKPYLEFVDTMEQAEAEAEAFHIERIKSGGPTGSQWIATRRWPDRWGTKTQVDVKRTEGPQVRVYVPDNDRGDSGNVDD